MQRGQSTNRCDGYCRHRRRWQRHTEYLNCDGFRCGRRRYHGRKTRQSQSQLEIRRCGRAWSNGHRCDGRCGYRRKSAKRVWNRLHDGPYAPPRNTARDAHPRGTWHAHDLQHSWSPDQPCRRETSTHRCLPSRSDPSYGRNFGATRL